MLWPVLLVVVVFYGRRSARHKARKALHAMGDTAAPTSRQPADPNWQSQEDRSPANEMHAGLEPAASEAEALGGSRTALGTTGSGAKSWPDSPLLRLQETVPLPVSSRRKWIPIARRVETGMERGPVEPVLRTGF